MATLSTDIQNRLQQFNQLHTVQFWGELSEAEQLELLEQLRLADFRQLREIWDHSHHPTVASSPAERISQAAAPKSVIRQPASVDDTNR